MQHSPPPLFKQGASARVKVVFFAVFSISLLLVDSRLKSLEHVRRIVGAVLQPLQTLALVPRDVARGVGDYFASTSALQKEVNALRQQQLLSAQAVQRTQLLASENLQLRRLNGLQEHLQSKSIIAEILYDARDEYARKIILNKGSQHGVSLSQPVIDDRGVIGQVTRVFPLTAEVTLLTDKNQAIPVQVERNGLHSVVNGRGRSSYLDMRITSNADIKPGDNLVTSGIDGIYPAGLQVAKVAQIENKGTTTFEVVLCTPVANIDHHLQLLILLVDIDKLEPPESEEVRAKKEKINRRVTRDSAKDAPGDANKESPLAEPKKDLGSAAPSSVTPASTAAISGTNNEVASRAATTATGNATGPAAQGAQVSTKIPTNAPIKNDKLESKK